MKQILKLGLEKQGYKIVGNHSGCKTCHYTKKSINNEDVCYKQKFYGIESHRCVQMTPNFVCNFGCVFCWRDLETHSGEFMEGPIDDAKFIVEGSIKAQRSLLNGFKGSPKADQKKVEESMDPKHFAISLNGEPTMYRDISGLITELHAKKISTFLVTNGYFPHKLKSLKEAPTQLYISVDAPTKELFFEIDRPLQKDAWEKVNETLEYVATLPSRTVLRFTLMRGMNMGNHREWADIIKKARPKFVEVKGYSHVGYSRERLTADHSPSHQEIKEFALSVGALARYNLVDEKEESRVVLLSREDSPAQKIDFETLFENKSEV